MLQLTWYKLWLRKLSKDSWWSSTPLQLVRTTPTESRAEIRAPSSMALTHHTHKHSPTLFPKMVPLLPVHPPTRAGWQKWTPQRSCQVLGQAEPREHNILHRTRRPALPLKKSPFKGKSPLTNPTMVTALFSKNLNYLPSKQSSKLWNHKILELKGNLKVMFNFSPSLFPCIYSHIHIYPLIT